MLETNEQNEEQIPSAQEQISQELAPADTPNTDVYQPIFTLFVDDDNTNNKSVNADLSVDNIGSTQVNGDIAVLSNDSEGNIENEVAATEIVDIILEEPVSNNTDIVNEGGELPICVNDGEISAEESLSIDIRGPPSAEIVLDNTINYCLGSEREEVDATNLSEDAIEVQPSGTPSLPGLYLVDPTTNFNGQVIYLDFDGAEDVTYNGPVMVEGIDIPVFSADAAGLAGQESEIISQIISNLEQQFEGTGVLFTTTKPESGTSYSTIFVGGNGSEFNQYGSFVGLSEKIDIGNQNQSDKSFLFSDNILSSYANVESFSGALTQHLAHETGHLLGYAHIEGSYNLIENFAAVAPDADRTFTHPAENNGTKNLTLAIGDYTFQVDPDPNGYHRVDWFTTYSGTSGLKDTAYLYYYDNEDFSFSAPGTYWVRAELYRSDFWNNTYEWEAVYRWYVTIPQPPALQLDTTSLDFGTSSTSKTFNVRNSGGGTLSYVISDNQSWLSVSPTSGSSTGEWDTITATVSRSGLRFGNYSGTITVDPDTGSNQTVSVSMTVPDATPTVSRKSPTSSSITIDYNTNQSFIATGQDSGGNLDYADWYLTGPENDHGTDYWYGDTDFTRDSSYSHLFDLAGDYTLKAEFTDSNGNKGSTSWSIHVNPQPKPDLIISDIKMNDLTSLPSVRPGDSVSLDFYGNNITPGTTSKSMIQMQAWWGTSQNSMTNFICTEYFGEINGLDYNENEETTYSWTIPQLSPGTYWLTAMIDTDNKQNDEPNEGNNVRSESFTVLEPLKPDLSVLNVYGTDPEYLTTDAINAYVDVENIGEATAGNCYVYYYLGTNTNPTYKYIEDGQLGGIYPLNDMSVNEVATDEINGTWAIPDDTPMGTYYIYCHAVTINSDDPNDSKLP